MENTPISVDEFNTISEDDPRHPNYVDTSAVVQSALDWAQEGVQQVEEALKPPEPEANVLSETGAAIAGGAADAVESVGQFADLTGDTLKAGFSQLFGRPVDDEENPFSKDYQHGTWLDIPDDWVPENKTALGKLARGFVEFGLLTAATGGVGGKVFAGARLGTRGLAIARSSGVGAKGSRYIKFLTKGSAIAAEGGVAELISSQSEDANIANLVDEFAPWIPLSKALSVDPEDNPWLARIKSVTAGAGVNLVGWGISGYAKGRWAARAEYKKARAEGNSIEESLKRANDEGNVQLELEIDTLARQSEEASTRSAANNFVEGKGISHADNIDGRVSDPKVNPTKHLDSEKADIVTSPSGAIMKTAVKDLKSGGTGRSWQHMWTAYSLKRMGGDKAARLRILEQTRDELVDSAFKNADNTKSYNELLELTDHHIEQGLEILMDGNDIANRFKKLLRDDPHNYRVFMTAGDEIRTITPAQKAAVQLNMAMLADTATAISQSAVELVDDVPIGTQYEQVMDAMKVLLIEHKRFGVMWGLDGVAQQLDQIPENLAKQAKIRIKEIDDSADEYFSALDGLRKQGRWQEMKALMEIHAITGNKVNTLDEVHDFLAKKLSLKGGTIHGLKIRGEVEQQLLGTWYNSVLSSVRTPIKAIAGTNLIATLRPFQAYIGAWAGGNKEEMVVAASMINSLRAAFAEGMDMFRYNWDAGVHRQTQTYDIRYDLGEDMRQWKQIGETIQNIGTPGEKRAYAAIDKVADFNNNPWVRYSTNAMGAGDALARTVIGRMEMRQRAVRQAIGDGVDLDDVTAIARKTEENFRKEIFKEGKDGKWVVHDKGAMMAGDEAAMTRNLEGAAKAFDDLNEIPLLRAFFPFARTGVNALNLTFEHVPGLARTQRKFRDILSGDPERLAQWGIRPEDAANARAMAEGRLAMGKAIGTMTALWTLSGNMTGDYPYDKEGRDLWKLNNIPPYSIKVGDTWISYRNIEPFNTVASMTANLVTNADVLGETVVDEGMQKAMFMFSAVMIDKSMLSGVKELFSVFDPEQQNRGPQLARVIASKVRPLGPYAGLSKDIGNILDSVKKEKQSLGEMIISRDALLKSTLPPQYDILSVDRSGKAFKRNHAFFGGTKGVFNPLLAILNSVSPIPIIPAEKIKVQGKWVEDPVKVALMQMRYNLPEILNTYKGVTLNSHQKSRLQYHLSRSTLRKDLERIILSKNSPVQKGIREYKKGGFRESEGYLLRDTPWYRMVHRVFAGSGGQKGHIALAMEKVMAEDPAFRQAVRLREHRGIATKTGETDRMQKLLNLPK